MTTSKSEQPMPGQGEGPLPNVGPPGGNWEPHEPPPADHGQPATPVFAAGSGGNAPPEPAVLGLGGDGGVVPSAPVDSASGLWLKDREITHLWSSSGSPGVWAWITGLGWKRLESSETGRSPLTTLALLAKANGLPVSYHENSAGQIDQILL